MKNIKHNNNHKHIHLEKHNVYLFGVKTLCNDSDVFVL